MKKMKKDISVGNMLVKEEDLTSKQKECVRFNTDHDLLVQGIAGSGKSLVLIYRALGTAVAAQNKGENPKIAIFTYTKALNKFTKEIVDLYPDITYNFTVSPIDSVLKNMYSKIVLHGKFFKINYHDKQAAGLLDCIVKEKSKKNDNRFLKKNMHDFIYEELKWIKQRSNELTSFDQYAKAKRYGRGTSIRLTQKDRQIIWEIYEEYFAEAKKQNIYDSEAVFAELAEKADLIPDDLKYDYVFVDECQDLGLTKLRLAKALANKSITLVADLAQMIYHVGFSWSEMGINIKGQASKKLGGSFRNTKEIALLAEGIKKHNTSLPRDDIETDISTREGEKPVLYYESNPVDKMQQIAGIIRKRLELNPEFTIAIIVWTKEEVANIKKGLECNGIQNYQIYNKELFEMLSPGVKLITYHSSKGLEFDEVILPFLDEGRMPKIPKGIDQEQEENMMNDARSLLYVGMTRAKYRLVMFALASSPSPFIQELDRRYYEIG